MRRLIVFLICILFPNITAAYSISPYFNVFLTVNSGEMEGFQFKLEGYYPNDGIHQATSINSIDGVGTGKITVTIGSQASLHLYQVPKEGWKDPEIECVSSNPNITFINVPRGINIGAYGFNSIECSVKEVRSTQYKTPVLLVPGVLGTDIIKGDDLLWANPRMSIGFDNFMDPLQFKEDLHPLDTSLEIDKVIREKKIAGVGSDYTQGLIQEFVNQGYEEGKDLFTFPYDWRFGVSSVAEEHFKGQIDYIVNQTEAGKAAGKVDVVAHSTGGLITKKYIYDHATDHHLGKVVFVGVPNLGAPKAIKALVVGDDFDVLGLDPAEMKMLSKNMPVVYDLSPSQAYYNKAGSYMHVTNPLAWKHEERERDLNFEETSQHFVNYNLFNEQAVEGSKSLHTEEFDSYDPRSAGVEAYSIAGCKNPTFGKFSEHVSLEGPPQYDFPENVSGDKTVPLLSAASIPVDSDKSYFIPKVTHGNLLSANGVRQHIVNIVTGSKLDTAGKILNHDSVVSNLSQCEIKGHQISILSPVSIQVTDNEGNVAGIVNDGSIENTIPGAGYEVWGDHKYVFLPDDEDQSYSIQLHGTDVGNYTVKVSTIGNDAITETFVFPDHSVSTTTQAQLVLSNPLQLKIDNDSDGVYEISEQPAYSLNSNESRDMLPPVATSTIEGVKNVQGQYEEGVDVRLAANDLVSPNFEDRSTGVYEIKFKNQDDWTYRTYTTNLTYNAPGDYSLSFYAIDRAGNKGDVQTILFSIAQPMPATPLSSGGGIVLPREEGKVLGLSTATNTAITAHDSGSLVFGEDGQTVYIIANGKKYGFRNADEFLSYGYSFAIVVPGNVLDFELPNGGVLKAKPGTLVKLANGEWWLVTGNGEKKKFRSQEIAIALGYFLNARNIDLKDYKNVGLINSEFSEPLVTSIFP